MDPKQRAIAKAVMAERERQLVNLSVYQSHIDPVIFKNLEHAASTGINLAEAMELPLSERPVGWFWPDVKLSKPASRKKK